MKTIYTVDKVEVSREECARAYGVEKFEQHMKQYEGMEGQGRPDSRGDLFQVAEVYVYTEGSEFDPDGGIGVRVANVSAWERRAERQ